MGLVTLGVPVAWTLGGGRLLSGLGGVSGRRPPLPCETALGGERSPCRAAGSLVVWKGSRTRARRERISNLLLQLYESGGLEFSPYTTRVKSPVAVLGVERARSSPPAL